MNAYATLKAIVEFGCASKKDLRNRLLASDDLINGWLWDLERDGKIYRNENQFAATHDGMCSVRIGKTGARRR